MLISANIFQPLIDVFESVIEFFHNHVGLGWGWSIVLLTVCVRLVLMPLMLKQFHSMQRMQAHMPELKALQAKYKDDKQRQQQEVMKFYRENNMNPMASCLPLVLQLPVFLSLFYMLRKNLREDICPTIQATYRSNYALKHPGTSHSTLQGLTTACGAHAHAGFLFINDLTNTAKGLTLVVLLVLYVGTQMASTLIMSAPTMDQTQRRLMMFLPLVFVLFIIRFPAGLIVYWITTNGWTMLQQAAFKARLRRTQPPAAAIAGGGSSTVVIGETKQIRTRGGAAANGDSAGNGSSPPTGGLAGLLRGGARSGDTPPAKGTPAKAKGGKAPEPAGARAKTAVPPPSPRKKKKRSGRRR
jgi:YidC/Oxa1 family membrane protein insertase